MRLLDPEEKDSEGMLIQPIEQLPSDDEEEGVVEEKPKEEEIVITEYSCMICTFINPVSQMNCCMCDSKRPSMEELIEMEKAKRAPPETDSKPAEGESEEVTPKHLEFIEMLAKDCGKIIMCEEKRVIQ
jgi:hypothetical protein